MFCYERMGKCKRMNKKNYVKREEDEDGIHSCKTSMKCHQKNEM